MQKQLLPLAQDAYKTITMVTIGVIFVSTVLLITFLFGITPLTSDVVNTQQSATFRQANFVPLDFECANPGITSYIICLDEQNTLNEPVAFTQVGSVSPNFECANPEPRINPDIICLDPSV